MAAPMPQVSCGHLISNGICSICFYKVYRENQVLEDSVNLERVNSLVIKEQIYKSKRSAKFLRKWNSVPTEVSDTGDVTLFCTSDGSSLTAHGFILASRSDVFRAMLEEADMKEKETKRVEIHEGGGESVSAFLKFLYTVELSDEDLHSHYRELVKLAHFYQVQLLLQRLDDFISQNAIRKDFLVFIETLELAYLYGLEKTKKAALNLLAVEDQDRELYDVALGQLEVHHPWMAPQFSSDMVSFLKSGTA